MFVVICVVSATCVAIRCRRGNCTFVIFISETYTNRDWWILMERMI